MQQKRNIFIAIILIFIFLIGVAAGCFVYRSEIEKRASLSAQNCKYIIGGNSVTLRGGYSEEGIAPDSFSKIVTRYLGDEAVYDFNRDGLPDVAFVLTQNMGGSGTYYYVAVALSGNGGYKGVDAVFLGDRIGLKNIEVRNGIITVRYNDRRIDEPMVAHPSIEIVKQFAVREGVLEDIIP